MTRRNSPVKNRRAAFTLIELMVVLVVIAIISAVMIAEMGGNFQDALLRSSSRQLISVFNLASSRAISVNRLHRVRFDRLTGQYVVEKHLRGDEFAPAEDVSGGTGTVDPRIAFRIEDAGGVEASPSGEESQAPAGPPDNVVNFYPDGTADAREVELRDRDGFGVALRVSPVSSRVQIIELQRQ